MRSEWVSNQIIEEILRNHPDKVAERRRRLADPDWCARHPESVRNLHNPDHMRHVVEVLNDLANPFSQINMARQAAELELRMINTAPSYRYVLRDPKTGEVVDEERFSNHVDPHDPAARAYVADLN